MSFTDPTVITFGIYLALMVGIGFVAWKRTRDFDDYILGGRATGGQQGQGMRRPNAEREMAQRQHGHAAGDGDYLIAFAQASQKILFPVGSSLGHALTGCQQLVQVDGVFPQIGQGRCLEGRDVVEALDLQRHGRRLDVKTT